MLEHGSKKARDDPRRAPRGAQEGPGNHFWGLETFFCLTGGAKNAMRIKFSCYVFIFVLAACFIVVMLSYGSNIDLAR